MIKTYNQILSVRIATAIFNKLKKLHVWNWIDSKPLRAQQAAQTSHQETHKCEVPEADDLTTRTTLPPSAPANVGPSNQQGSIAAPTSNIHATAGDQNGSRPQRRRAIPESGKREAPLGSPDVKRMRSKSPVSSMPHIPQSGQQKNGALELSTGDIVTHKSVTRPAQMEVTGRKKKAAKGGSNKPAALKTCPTCGRVQPGARQKKCACGHNFQAAKDAERERKMARKAEDRWPALKVFNQACNGAEAACLHNADVQIVVYAAVPGDDFEKRKAGFNAQARGFGYLGKDVSKKVGKTFIHSAQMASSYLHSRVKKAEKKDTQSDEPEGATSYTSVHDFLQQICLLAIMDKLPSGLTLDLLKYINQEQMKTWDIDNIFWENLAKCAQRISS
ncbi:g9446 [Coccomyxa elongata]